jgi:hypothetical protein
MPDLDQMTVRKLASHPRSRDGVAVPNTGTGLIYDYACWNWVLSGGTLIAAASTSNDSIIGNVLVMDYSDQNDIFATGIRDTAATTYHDRESRVDLLTMRNSLTAARTGGSRFSQGSLAQEEFLKALVRLMMRANGLTPIPYSPDNRFNVVVRSSEWWNTDHWALMLNLGLPRPIFVQTVPGYELRHSCNDVWDEGLPSVKVGLRELHQNQVDQLSAIPWSRCRMTAFGGNNLLNLRIDVCNNRIDTGIRAGQCWRCGYVLCPEHVLTRLRGQHGHTCPDCLLGTFVPL